MKRLFAIAAMVLSVWSCIPGIASAMDTKMSRPAFQEAMRALWEDHVAWTRLYIISALAGLPDQAATTDRLLRNQSDIGNAIKPYYGEAAGEKLTDLLKEHITTAAELIAAAKAGDHARQDAATQRWFKNADDIAAFLSSANPGSWARDAMQSMMHEHLNVTTEEVVARLKRDWPADVAAYDRVNRQILMMADMLSAGIIHQFPDLFRNE